MSRAAFAWPSPLGSESPPRARGSALHNLVLDDRFDALDRLDVEPLDRLDVEPLDRLDVEPLDRLDVSGHHPRRSAGVPVLVEAPPFAQQRICVPLLRLGSLAIRVSRAASPGDRPRQVGGWPMPLRSKRGKVVRTSTATTLASGRPSRGRNARPVPLARLDSEEGALARLVVALADPALYSDDEADKLAASKRIRGARARLRKVVGDEREVKRIFALAAVSAGERRVMGKVHEALGPHLVEQGVATIRTLREFVVDSWTARTEVAVAGRLLATGLALLDEGSKQLDTKVLAAGAAMIAQAQRMRDGALDVDRRAKLSAKPADFTAVIAQRAAEVQARRAATLAADGGGEAPNPGLEQDVEEPVEDEEPLDVEDEDHRHDDEDEHVEAPPAVDTRPLHLRGLAPKQKWISLPGGGGFFKTKE